MATVLAVDLGGTKTAIGFVDHDGNISGFRKLPATSSLDACAAVIGTCAAGVDAVGVIVPGIYNVAAGTAWCPNLFGPDEVSLLAALRKHTRAPITIDSDRSGYVLGESWLGAARGLSDVVFIGIGTGIGVGVLSAGRVVRGAHGIAGAAGWWSLTPEWNDLYAHVGCWEGEAAGPAVARLGSCPTAEEVVAAARLEDAHARGALAHAADFTGRAVANLISIFDPEMVVLGGGLMHGAGDLLLQPVRATAARWAQPISFGKCRIDLSSLGENAGLLGAARLAWEGA